MLEAEEMPGVDDEPATAEKPSRRENLKWWALLAFGAVGWPELVHLFN